MITTFLTPFNILNADDTLYFFDGSFLINNLNLTKCYVQNVGSSFQIYNIKNGFLKYSNFIDNLGPSTLELIHQPISFELNFLNILNFTNIISIFYPHDNCILNLNNSIITKSNSNLQGFIDTSKIYFYN